MGVKTPLTQACETIVRRRQQQGLYRQRHVSASAPSELNFSSNDYLSLTFEKRLQAAYQQGFATHCVGSGASMVVCGYHPEHRALEKAFAEALSLDDAVVFSSGYVANLSVVSLLSTLPCSLLIDRGVHASIYDGLTLAQATYTRYRHHDMWDAQQKMQHGPGVVLTESVFSMSGHVTPLDELARVSQPLGYELVVDEAHAFGVLGREGLGGVVHAGLTQQEVPLRIIPLGKAGAATGAMVVGHAAWIDALVQVARPYIYSTAISPAVAVGLRETLTWVREADDRRSKLHALIAYFGQKAQASPLTWRASISPIQQLQLGCPHRALHYGQRLKAWGIVCVPMRTPTVSKRDTGLRVLLNYHHEPAHIDRLFTCLETIYAEEVGS